MPSAALGLAALPAAKPDAFERLRQLHASEDGLAFTLLLPAAVTNRLVSQICLRYANRGLEIAAMKMLRPGGGLACADFEARGRDAAAMEEQVVSLAQGPVVAIAWRGPDAISATAKLAGALPACTALPGTIRGDLDLNIAGAKMHTLAADVKK
eukprot:6212798-Pleurochrysis_carterae.AAC.4